MRLIPIFPKSVDGLFREVRDLHVDPKSAPLIFISSCISLAVGASVGPEVSERRKEKRREEKRALWPYTNIPIMIYG